MVTGAMSRPRNQLESMEIWVNYALHPKLKMNVRFSQKSLLE